LRLGITALLACILLPGAAFAQSRPEGPAVTLRLDPATTEIHFTTGGLFHKRGVFKLKLGQIAFDPSTGVAQGQVLVDAASGATGDKKFDAKMQNEVLESQKYPEIFLHAEKVTGTLKQGEQHLSLSGSFNMHGADHPLKVDADVTIKGEAAIAKTSFTVPYTAWGMKDESTLLMRGKDVRVDVVAHGTVEGLKKQEAQ
jgi:polyisoprenoid-binding protein YceI